MRNSRYRGSTLLTLCLILLSTLHAHTQESKSPTEDNSSIVVAVTKTQGRVIWAVDSKPAEDPLHALAVLSERRGHSTAVIVLLDKNVPLDMIWEVEGTAWKAQLDHLRFFLVDRETATMREINRGPAIPISKQPPPPPN